MATDTQQLSGTYTLDPIHSHVGFSIKHMVVATYRGSFESFDAKLVDGVLDGTVDVGSVKVKDDNLAGHLQSPDFFDAEHFPQITFRSTSITVDGDAVTVEGELTLKGVTKPISGTGELSGPGATPHGEKLGISLQTKLDRTEFGLDWNAELPKGGFALGNDVKVEVDLELLKAEA